MFANAAFADMVGYGQDALTGLAFPETFRTVPAELCALSTSMHWRIWSWSCSMRGLDMRARMSKSAMMRRDDPVVLVTFENLTEQLWTDDRCVPWG